MKLPDLFKRFVTPARSAVGTAVPSGPPDTRPANNARFSARRKSSGRLRTAVPTFALALIAASAFAAPDFSAVFRILDERCVECHTADDNEAGLILETYEGLMKGGETGVALVAGKSAESLMVKYLRGEVEKDGKKKFMPPGKRERLTADEIKLIADWIDAGAKPGTGLTKMREINVPKIAPKVAPRLAVNALAFSASQKLIAVGRYGIVELRAADTRDVVRKLEGHKGNVNALAFSPDGTQLFAASGENAITGEVRQWNVADGALIRTITGHRDTLYALALSPDGKTLATGSYDQQIKLWNTADGAELKTLRGHNGAVFALAFRPDGALLASASADRTIKLWHVATAQRRDTLSQPTQEQATLAWSPDGKHLAAAGADNRIRVYEVSAEAKETTNPLITARFAHENPITRLVWGGKTLISAAQDGIVKLWDAAEMRERAAIPKQPDWPSALASLGDASFIAGRLDGSLACYDIKDGKPIAAAAPAPAKVAGIEPRGIQRGGEARVKLLGTNLAGLRFVAANDPRVRIEFTDAELFIHTPADLPRASYDIAAVGADGKHAGIAKLFIDDLPQTTAGGDVKLPAGIWGKLAKPGDTVRIGFEAKASHTIVFDLAAKSLGSKADATLSLLDASGKVLASSTDFDATGDPLIAHTFAADGRFTVAVSDKQFGGSAEHFFRLSAGALPFVTAAYPLSIPAQRESEIELVGFNLPAERKIKVQAGAAGEMPLPLDLEKVRARSGFKLLVSDLASALEAEPNNDPATATAIPAPSAVSGRFDVSGDKDLFKFEAKQGSKWAVETQAAQRGSPADTKIEILDATGKPIERLLLQAVRDSAVTFRPIDSITPDVRVDNWREMELNELMMLGGEVAKIYRMPEGPDSGFQFYQVAGKRRAYLDTTPTAHALDEPAYIVEPHPPGAKLVSNGLPTFSLYYANDDDGLRKGGTDSRLLFTAPTDGAYLVRVSDSRGLGADRFAYRLTVREAREDFTARIAETNFALNAGSGQSFTVNADRMDGFDGDITIDIAGVPDGYKVSTPLIIQAGHVSARGTLIALPGAKEADWSKVKVSAIAKVATHEVNNFGKVTLGKEPQVTVALEPAAPGDTLQKLSPATPLQPQDPAKPFEITIAPDEIIPAWIKIRRNGANGDLRFDVENLPHGVIVDNLGLSGITLLTGQNEGEIALKAAPWVADQDALCFAITREAGKQSSLPVMLHVRKREGARVLTVK